MSSAKELGVCSRWTPRGRRGRHVEKEQLWKHDHQALRGYAGFTDQIDHHYLQTFGTALLMSTISAGQMVGQLTAFGSNTYSPYGYAPPSQWALAGEAAGAGASGQLGQVGQQSLQQGMNRPPTLKIRAGYEFNVMVTRDLVMAGPYKG